MRTLSVDIETYSSQDLGKVGVYKYVDSPDFRILLFAYQYDDSEEVNVIDLTEQELPKWLADDLLDPSVRKTAFNAQFERVALNKHLGAKTANWECTMIKSWMMGFSGGLAAVSKALGVKAEDGKKREGQALIRMFCMPRKPTKANPGTEVFTSKDRPAEWQSFIEYNRQDVVVEKWIRDKLAWYDLPVAEQNLYGLDQQINDRGVGIDLDMAANAVKIDTDQTEYYTEIFQEITGIPSPNQLQTFKDWLSARGRGAVKQITKGNRDELEKQFEGDEDALTAIECRFRTGKASTAKYQKMLEATCADGRIRGTLQFYGAQRTGRFCLAEGTQILVKTESGEVLEKPIEKVLLTDLVYDGFNWVEHDGVVESGWKDAIEWDGIVATRDHLVFINELDQIPLQEAKEKEIPIWRGNVPDI